MKTKIMNKEKFINTNETPPRLLNGVLARRLYPGQPSLTISEAISQSALAFGKSVVADLNQAMATSASGIVSKITPRAETWNYQDQAQLYNQATGLNDLIVIATKEAEETRQIIDAQLVDAPPDRYIIARQWWADSIGYETRAAIKRKETGKVAKTKYQQEIVRFKLNQLKRQPDPDYKDTYNQLVCQRLDQLEASGQVFPESISKLDFVASQIEQEMVTQVADEDIIAMLAGREAAKLRQRLTRQAEFSWQQLGNREQATNFAALMFELEQRKTDEVWNGTRFRQIVMRGLQGEKLDLVTMLCTINEFPPEGGYRLNPDLFAYQQNPKVEPVPLIIDEMASLVSLFGYYEVNCQLTMYVADTDYTEIKANGPVTGDNLVNLDSYLANLKQYITKYDVPLSVKPISEVTNSNPIYNATKERVSRWVNGEDDLDFNRLWYQKFEKDVEKRNETIEKKKLFAPSELRKKSLEIARNIWAVNAAQGAYFSTLGENTVIISTERRERDQNYIVDKEATKNFPPVIYVLQAAEKWNRKIVDQTIFGAK